MNSFEQQENFLIGSKHDIEELAKKPSARFLIISDSHENEDAIFDILDNFGADCDALIFCGDGCLDFFAYFEKAKLDSKMQENLPGVIALVHGNCDSEEYTSYYEENDGITEKKTIFPEKILFTAANRQIFVTHGQNYGVNHNTDFLVSATLDFNADFIFYGHSHVAKWEEVNGILVLNPGSCTLPRGIPYPTFAIVEFPAVTERFEIHFFAIETNAFGKNSFFRINLD